MRAKHVADVSGNTLRRTSASMAATRCQRCTPTKPSQYHWIGSQEFAKHKTVNHSKDEYFKDGAGVQSAEAFFAILKRGIIGSFHSVSEQHLQRYVDEFVFRWDNRSALGVEDFERAAKLLKGASGKRLTYRPTDKGSQPSQADA